ncbi:unnamed protein product [Phaedon cochleariae]|uniref:Uncharacterized protein n=1 Tax=Phaedon cochleariae TaxID=80249 RepID=A0A9N9X4A2_PHACE|nr:unnamed protein product [Phaedon cochleariae]
MDARITFSSLGASKDSDFLHVTYTGSKKDASVSVDSVGYVGNTSTKKETIFSQSNIGVSKNSKSNEVSQVDKKNVGVMKRPQFNNIHSSYSSAFSIEKPENEEKEAKSLILVRCDFKKSVNSHPYYPPPFNCSTSLIDYFKEEQNCTLNQSKPPQKSPKSNSMPPRRDSRKMDQSPIVLDSEKSNTDSDSPSMDSPIKTADTCEEVQDSPESRKKELCSYLQLMNPADKKEIYILQNRRSTRVRNLAVMQQKQKQLQVEFTETEVKSNDKTEEVETQECPAKIDQKEGENRQNHETFCFPFPPEHLMKTVNDFDVTMSKVVPKLKRMCRYKNIKLSTDDRYKIEPLSTKRSDENGVSTETVDMKALKLTPKKTVQRSMITGKRILNDRANSLRSTGKLKNVSLKKLLRKEDTETSKWKSLKQKEMRESHKVSTGKPEFSPKPKRPSKAKTPNSHCEIVTVPFGEDNDDSQYFMEDMVDFDSLSEEHRKCLIESRIFSKPVENSSKLLNDSISSIRAMSPLYGFSKSESSMKNKISNNNSTEMEPCLLKPKAKKPCKEVISGDDSKSTSKSTPLYGNNTYLILNFHGAEPKPVSKEKKVIVKEKPKKKKGEGASLSEHDYAGHPNEKKKIENADVDVETVPIKNMHVGYLEVNTKFITKKNKFEILPHKTSEIKSLHRSLQFDKKKNDNLAVDASLAHEWDATDGSPKQKSKKQSHSITIAKENGQVIKAFYVDYNLIVCQEYVISFWMQTPLGNILGSQDMWVPRGHTQRLVLSNKCTQKDSMEKVICTESSVVYIELWMKEHKSEMRQGPVADVFVALYFWKQRQNGLDKKVLQLENINGFADDVQYSVMKTAPKIIVSWHSANEDTATKRTFIHAYLLAGDYQTVSNVYDIEPVDHYVSSLHNIEDCDSLIMGCGENKITLWNVEFGYIVATIELSEIKSPLSTLWVKCDRGFLFALQQCVDRELRLVAINGMNHSWKKLASYLPPEGFDRLRGVCLENGLLLSFYDQGILCWKAESGEPVDEIAVENDIIPSGKYVILIEDNQIIVKHVVTHLMSVSVDES